MPFVFTCFSRELAFRFDARTSRGAMHTHRAYFLRLHHTQNPQEQGWGECSPLPGLSPDYSPQFNLLLKEICARYNALLQENPEDEVGDNVWRYLQQWPSICFAFETAWLDYLRGAKQQLYNTSFSRSEKGIRINGLIWMGDPGFMREQIEEKMKLGFTCLKLKIGGLDFEQEVNILQEIRKIASPADLELRLDANGSFNPQAAEEKIRQLANFHIHSIEQPIMPGQLQDLEHLCRVSAIPIALDEELIGVNKKENKWELLARIRPTYIIIKPTLVGGLYASREWVQVAKSLGIEWWLTSALESNIGLNAIAQFAADLDSPMPQGLGTGQLYHNNISSPLEIRGEELWYDATSPWLLPQDK